MPSKNRVNIMGHLGRDAEVRFTPSGAAVANFSVATSERWKDKTTGEKMERTEWHNIVVWGKPAEFCGERGKKGALVDIEGKIQTREWEDKDGNKRKTTEIVAQQVLFLKFAEGDYEKPAPEDDDDSSIPF